jgi:hypothetical protein
MKSSKGATMVKSKPTSEKPGFMFSSWMDKAWRLGLQPVLETFTHRLEDRVEQWERHFLALVAPYLGMCAGFFFLALGVFFLLVDYAGVPRGVVFTAGGLLILLVSFLLVQVGKKR